MEALAAQFHAFLVASQRTFPHGWCDSASQALARIFFEQRGIKAELVCGRSSTLLCELGNPLGHTWLQVSSVVVDLTAHQFADRPEALPLPDGILFTSPSPWHEHHFPKVARDDPESHWTNWTDDMRSFKVWSTFRGELSK
jgi:hypothetical protein